MICLKCSRSSFVCFLSVCLLVGIKGRDDESVAVIAPFTHSSIIRDKMQLCAKTWKVEPIQPFVWKGPAVFPANKSCELFSAEEEDDVCRLNRFVNFPQCNISVIIPHKSASSMIMAQFENICGFPQFKSSEHSGFITTKFGFDHKQDHILNNDTLLSQSHHHRKLRHRSRFPTHPFNETKHFIVAVLRDPIERLVGMYNMMGSKDVDFGNGTFFSPLEMTKIVDHWEEPSNELILWRFSQFISYLKSKPLLIKGEIHYSPQARYLGVGCNYTLLKPDLIGRSEKLPQLFSMIASEEPLFKAAYEVYIDKGGNIPPWYFRMHDARGDWSMTPCDVNAQLYEQIKGAFEDDFNCFGQDVLTNTKLVFT